jgi:hypothetical protein
LSYFLIVPLALNAFILCPIVIARAMRAKRLGGVVAVSGKTGLSLALAAITGVLIVIYLVLVLTHQPQ